MLRSDHREATAWSAEALALPGVTACVMPGAAVPVGRLAVAYAFDAVHHFAVDDLARAIQSAEVTRQLSGAGDGTHPAPMMVTTIIKFMRSDPVDVLAYLARLAESADRWTSAVTPAAPAPT